MDRTVSASEANQRFSELLRGVAEGGSFTVTSRGKPIARILPVDQATQAGAVRRLIERLEREPLRYTGSWTRADLYD